MKKILLVTAATLAMGSAVLAQDTVSIATEGAYAPWNFIDEASGAPAGYEIDLGNAICEKAAISCEWIVNDWDSIIPNLLAGNYDVIMAGMSITDERLETIDFTQNYFPPDPSRYVAQAGHSLDFANLSGARVGVQGGTIQAAYAEQNLAAANTVVSFGTADQAMADLAAGNLDTILADGAYLEPIVTARMAASSSWARTCCRQWRRRRHPQGRYRAQGQARRCAHRAQAGWHRRHFDRQMVRRSRALLRRVTAARVSRHQSSARLAGTTARPPRQLAERPMIDDIAFWLGYVTNGKHLAWYASFQFTIFAALAGGALAVVFGLVGATLKNSPNPAAAADGHCLFRHRRGVPDVLFFLFFPLAFEQAVEWVIATQVCTPEPSPPDLALAPLQGGELVLGTPEYLVLASVSLGPGLWRLCHQCHPWRHARRTHGSARSRPCLWHVGPAGALARPHPPDVGLCPAGALQCVDADHQGDVAALAPADSRHRAVGRPPGRPEFSARRRPRA